METWVIIILIVMALPVIIRLGALVFALVLIIFGMILGLLGTGIKLVVNDLKGTNKKKTKK